METRVILDKAVNHTFNDYLYRTREVFITEELAKISQAYSSMILVNIIKNKTKSFKAFEKNPELKEYMKNLSIKDIKKELLKNMAHNAILIKMNMNKKNDENETRISQRMDADEYSVIVYNNMSIYGVSRGYIMLQKYSILLSACELYVRNRMNNRGAYFDDIALSNEEGIAINNAIDEYFDNKTKTKTEKVKSLIKK